MANTSKKATGKEMRDRLATRLAREIIRQGDAARATSMYSDGDDEIFISSQLRLSAMVDAILSEIREPDEAMIYDGVYVNDMGDPHDSPPTRYEVERAFTAMIDAIRTGDET